MKGDSIRLRLTQPEVARLREHGHIAETCHFPGGAQFAWTLRASPDSVSLAAAFDAARLTVTVSSSAVELWARTSEVGIYGNCDGIQIAIEKDFRCVGRPGDPAEADAFPNPAQKC